NGRKCRVPHIAVFDPGSPTIPVLDCWGGGPGFPTPGFPDCADFAQSGMATIPVLDCRGGMCGNRDLNCHRLQLESFVRSGYRDDPVLCFLILSQLVQ